MSVSMMIAAALVGTTAPLATPATPATTVATTVTTTVSAPVAGPATRVCIRNHRVGSIAASKICRRYDRWLSDGIDPLAAPAVR